MRPHDYPGGSPFTLIRMAAHPWAAVVGALLILTILWDAFQTIILARRVNRRLRPTRAFYRLLWTPLRAATRRMPASDRRENILMVFGPLSLLSLMALWAYGLIFSFALLHWGLGSQIAGPDGHMGFGVDLYMSGTTFFTLGLGDATPRTTLARGLTVLECGLGFAFLAIVIGYVPLISQAFSRREVSISMLDASAGSPPTAGMLLRRHLGDEDGEIRELLRDWERWTAEVLESHLSFPVLAYFRSQHDNQSWVSALTAILDVCALLLTRVADKPLPAARPTFGMARHAVKDLCAVFRLQPTPPPDRLPAAEERRLERLLAQAGVRLRADDASVADFVAMRATYEPYVNALSSFLLMPLPTWAPPDDAGTRGHTIV